MLFAKFQSLTHKIDSMIICDLKGEMPLKYWSFRLAEFVTRIGMIGFVFTFFTYFGLGLIMQYLGESLPEPFVEGLAKASIALIAITIVGFIIRGGLYAELEKKILDKWHRYIQ